MTDREIALTTPIPSLAYLGDAVYEVMVRERLVRRGVKSPSVQSLEYVTAGSQSDAVERILPHLTDEEADLFRRGRNDHHSAVPKHAAPAQYRRATGLEALFGFLYLAGEIARLRELFGLAFPEE
ncbi:MAG: ribonuclease III [Clostridia bacterium]|nr:ribonuclease III [Clostridia bacterium]